MLSENDRRNLRVRAELDKIEAGSEAARSEHPDALSISFSETARKDLEGLAAFMSRPPSEIFAWAARNEASRFEELSEKLHRFAASHPSRIECATLPALSGDPEIVPVVMRLEDGEIVKLFQAAADGRWERKLSELLADPEAREPEVQAAHLQQLIDRPVSTEWVTTNGAFAQAALNDAAARWLERHFPELSTIPRHWVAGTDNAQWHKDYVRQRSAKSLLRPGALDRLIDAFRDRDEE